MITIVAQSIASGQSLPPIVIRTVHGDAISVAMTTLSGFEAGHSNGSLPTTDAPLPSKTA